MALDLSSSQSVLDFWFGAPGSPEYGTARDEWFSQNAGFDRQVIERFGPLIEQALKDELADWANEPQSALARILLLDQFTRNGYRGTPQAFAGDALALKAAQDMVARGWDLLLRPLDRVFIYLPFEHAEDLAAQRQALHLFTKLAEADPQFVGYATWARKHHDVIERFGRFPHRNAVLGQASTPEEEAFLTQPGSRF